MPTSIKYSSSKVFILRCVELFMKEAMLFFAAFVTGALVMMLEILGFRMFAPYFGYSIYVSGMLIGIVLMALSIGAYLGGFLADRKPEPRPLIEILLITDLYLFAIAYFYDRILQWLGSLAAIPGSFWASIILFAPPMLLLGVVSPYLIKLAASAQNIGMTVGKVTAVGTVGSIAGTFAVTFWLIPALGTHTTLYLSAVILLVLVLAMTFTKNKWYGLALVLLLLFNPKPVQSEENILFQEESAYNLVKVVEGPDKRYLKLNHRDVWQSVQDKTDLQSGYYYDLLNIAPLLANGKDMLILGFAGGVSAMQFRHLFNANVDGVEIDPIVVEAAHRYFGVPRDDPQLRIFVDDARPFLQKSVKRYDVIEIDLYQGGEYVPFYVLTKEFFALVRSHLKPDGVAVMNLYSHPTALPKADMLSAVGSTMAAVFPSVYLLTAGENHLLFAFAQSTDQTQIANALARHQPEHATLVDNAKRMSPFMPRGRVFTDDDAPVEQFTYNNQKLRLR